MGCAARRRDRAGTPRRAADTTAELASNRLLASWGRDAREMQLVLGAAGGAGRITTCDHGDAPDAIGPARCWTACRPTSAPTAPRRARRWTGRPTRAPRWPPTTAASIVHSCHGRVRQVEVLRDAILHALAEDETLEPRDVIVMCPDVESFAPLIQATFGAGELSAERRRGLSPRRARTCGCGSPTAR